MKHIANVHSNGVPNSIDIYSDLVFVPTNVHEFSNTTYDGTISGYEYDCDIYTKDEYIILMAQQANRIA